MMAWKAHFEIVFDYHFHQLGRFMDLVGELDDAEYHEARGHGQGSLHNLLHHVLNADRSWRIGIATGVRPESLDPQDYRDLGSVKRQLKQERQAWQKFLADASDEFLNEQVSLKSGSGRELTLPRVVIMQHVILHGMQHFSEVAERLSEFGKSPGNIDFIYFAMQR
jgi:uncharacterized damage-inducible protein DinB